MRYRRNWLKFTHASLCLYTATLSLFTTWAANRFHALMLIGRDRPHPSLSLYLWFTSPCAYHVLFLYRFSTGIIDGYKPVRSLPCHWHSLLIETQNIYKVGQKSKLLIWSECINKTEKTGWTWTNMNSCRKKWSTVWYFHAKYFYITIILCLNILWLEAVNEITARQTRASFAKFVKFCSTNRINVANFQVLERSQNYRIYSFRTIV